MASRTPSPRRRQLSDLKASILRPATTSNFQCWFDPPQSVKNWLNDRHNAGLLPKNYNGNEEFYSLSCSDAALPGSTLATHELTNDHSGVTERHVYRRQYDDRAEFSFYVDHDYNPILLFENWMAFIVNEQRTESAGFSSVNDELRYSYRVNFPQSNPISGSGGYTTQIKINKFEKDFEGGFLQYRFLKAFPISINTMPVSYNASDLLKVTVSFSYSRYVIDYHKESSVLANQRLFEANLDAATGGSNPIPGTFSAGLTGAGTIRELTDINSQIA